MSEHVVECTTSGNGGVLIHHSLSMSVRQRNKCSPGLLPTPPCATTAEGPQCPGLEGCLFQPPIPAVADV